jgi:hypothetical protein
VTTTQEDDMKYTGISARTVAAFGALVPTHAVPATVARG